MEEFGTPSQGDNLLGFTSTAGGAADPMSFAAAGESADPFAAAVSASPSTSGYADAFAGIPVKEGAGSTGPQESSALREWEAKHNEELEAHARKEADEKAARRSAAAAEMAKWTEERKSNISKKHSSNRSEEDALAAANKGVPKGDNSWEKIVDLIDTNARSGDEARDVSRMRALLLQLKAAPPAKAA